MRGVAVLGVILAHFDGLLTSGFIGVDIFFAISGYVITLSFIRTTKTGKNTREVLKSFWARRFWRLVPALALALSFTIIAAFFLLPRSDFLTQIEMSVWSAFFAGNIGVEVTTKPDYFNPASEENWLLHLWSLGVEEQFYLIFPLIMVAFLLGSRQRRSIRLTSWLVAIVGIVSFAAALADDFELAVFGSSEIDNTTGIAALLGYYSPLTRAWQFAIGIAAALHSLKNPGGKQGGTASFIGLALVAWGLLMTPESALLPGPATIIPMVGMYMILRWPLSGKLVENRFGKVLVWLGDRSYSAYLWHWPVWAVLTNVFEETFWVIPFAIAITLVAADLSYKLVEKRFSFSTASRPVRDEVHNQQTLPKVRRQASALLLLPLLLGGSILASDYALRASGLVLARQSTARVPAEIDCKNVDCLHEKVDVLLVGDSHAGALSGALSKRLAEDQMVLRTLVNVGCLHLLNNLYENENQECSFDEVGVEKQLSQNPPDAVVIFGYTAGRFTSKNSGGDQSTGLIDIETGAQVTDENGPNAYARLISDTVQLFTKRDIPVIIITGVPDFDFRPEEVNSYGEEASMAERMLPSLEPRVGQTVTTKEFLARHRPFIEVDQDLAKQKDLVSAVYGWDSLCDEDSCSQLTQDSQFIFSDQDHLGKLGAERLSETVAEVVSSLRM